MEIIIYTAICTAWGRLKTIHPYNGIENITSAARLSYTPRQQKKTIRLLQPGNVIRPKGKDEAAVIRGDQTEEESTLVNEVVRNGYFLPIYFNDRLTGPMFTFNGTCEDAMRYMINRMAAVPLLEVAPGIGDATKITFQATYKNGINLSF